MKQMEVLSLLLLAFMLVLTACGGGGKTNTGNTGNTGSTNTPVAEEPAPEEPVAEEPVIDLGGRTVKIAAWWDETPAGETAGEQARLAKMADMEQKYNFKFEFVNVPFEEYMDKLTTSTLAGEPFADVAVMEVKRALAAVNQGLVLPLSEFAQPTSDVNNEQRIYSKVPPIGGDEYAVWTTGVSVVGMYYNRDLFKKLGVQDPQELYASGEWTWEKFLDLAKEATRDTDNDGKLDTFGYSGWAADAARHLGVSNGALFVNEDLTNGMNDPKLAEALEFTSRLYNVENVVKVKSGNKMDWNETNTFKDGDVAMTINYDWNVGGLESEVGVVPVPAGPNSDGKHTYANTAQNGYFVLKGTKDAQAIYQIFEEMRDVPPTEEYVGQDWLEGRFTNEADIQMSLEHINGTGRLALEEGVADFPFYAVMDEAIVQNQSVAATLEKHMQAADAAVAKLK